MPWLATKLEHMIHYNRVLSCVYSPLQCVRITGLVEEYLAAISCVHFHRWMFRGISSERTITGPAHIFRIKFVLLQPQFGWGRTTQHTRLRAFQFRVPLSPKHVELSERKILDRHRQRVITLVEICLEWNSGSEYVIFYSLSVRRVTNLCIFSFRRLHQTRRERRNGTAEPVPVMYLTALCVLTIHASMRDVNAIQMKEGALRWTQLWANDKRHATDMHHTGTWQRTKTKSEKKNEKNGLLFLRSRLVLKLDERWSA